MCLLVTKELVSVLCTKTLTAPTYRKSEHKVVGDCRTVKILLLLFEFHNHIVIYFCNFRFDPERFSKENKATRSKCSFPAFGFAGNRVCPAEEYAYANATVVLVTLLRKFKIHVIEGQKVESVYGLFTHPKEEIWVNLARR